MLNRHLYPIAFQSEFGRQMRFISGPRQCGKTTLAKRKLEEEGCATCYFNWDFRPVKNLYRDNPAFFWEACQLAHKRHEKYWVCFDEIHKMPKWKNILKGTFDTYEHDIQFIVTGSARLDWFRKSGDSLVGRYFLFHLMPVTLRELCAGSPAPAPLGGANEFLNQQLGRGTGQSEAMAALLQYSGFPEPLEKHSAAFHQKWQETYMDQLVREDFRDITAIRELENIAAMSQFLGPRIGSPLSLNSLKEDLQVSYNAARSYLKALELGCVIFSLSPYSKKITRSVKKEKKVYFYDWTRVADPSFRFENYVAVECLSLIQYWNDQGLGPWGLQYIRTKEGKETDFLLTLKGAPWLLIEAKLTKQEIDSHHLRQAAELGGIPFVQVIAENQVTTRRDKTLWTISASRLFS